MWTKFVNGLQELFTGKDGRTLDLGRLSWAGSYIAVLTHDIKRPGTLSELAIALAAVATAHGVALGLKASTEPSGGANV